MTILMPPSISQLITDNIFLLKYMLLSNFDTFKRLKTTNKNILNTFLSKNFQFFSNLKKYLPSSFFSLFLSLILSQTEQTHTHTHILWSLLYRYTSNWLFENKIYKFHYTFYWMVYYVTTGENILIIIAHYLLFYDTND